MVDMGKVTAPRGELETQDLPTSLYLRAREEKLLGGWRRASC